MFVVYGVHRFEVMVPCRGSIRMDYEEPRSILEHISESNRDRYSPGSRRGVLQ